MRQGNGTELLGTDDPRVATIGIIYVSPHDDRKSVLAAILTQEKLGRKDVVIDLPGQNTAFARSQDFDDLKKIQRKLQSQIVFIIPRGSGIAEFANQRQFPVFSSFDSYQQAFERHNPLANDANNIPNGEKRRTFGSKSRTPSALDAALVGGISGKVVDAASSYTPPQNSRSGPGRNYIPASPTIDDEDALDDDEPQSHAPSPIPGRRTAPPLNNTPMHVDAFDDEEFDDDDEPVLQPPVTGRRTVPPLSRAPINQPELYDDEEDIEDPGDEDDDNSWTTPPPLHATRQPQLPEDPDKTVDRAELEAAGGAIAGVAAGALLSRNNHRPLEPVNTPPIGSQDDDEVEEDDDALPGIIDLQPKKPQRNTKKLNEAAGAGAASDSNSGPMQGSHKRRSGAIDATLTSVAGIAAGAAFNAATTSGQTGGAPSHGAVMRGPARPTSTGNNANAVIAVNATGNTGNRKPDKKKRRPIVGLLLILLLLLLLTALIGGLFMHSDPMAFKSIIQPFSNGIPGTTGSATTVTITPSSQQISDNYVIQTVSSGAKADQLQVSQRSLNDTPPSKTLTVQGTGQTQTQATQATGKITFFNSNQSEETVAANTVFTLSNGVKVENTEAANIPAANLPTVGEITVSATAITTGTAGNISYQALDSENCCGLGGITAENNTPFTGGKDPQNYTFVQQSDVDSATQQVVYTLSQEAITSFKKDLKSSERLIGNPNCPTNVSVDPNTVGDQGKNITSTQVTVSASCTGTAYDYTELQSVANTRLPLKATQKLGSAYVLTGNIATSITNVTTQTNGATLLVNAKGTWVYQISQSTQTSWKQLIAGKRISAADLLLERQTGIAHVNIPGKPGDTLPTDPNQISISVLSVPGTPAVATPGNNFNPVEATPTASAINGNGLTPNTKQVA